MTATDLRKRVELESKLSSLERELDAWLDASEAGRRLEKHRSQIVAVKRVLDHPRRQVQAELSGDDERLTARAQQLEAAALELHRLWDFFRGKLAQRYIDHFGPTLRAADELAWKCFEPARRQAEHGREPPLVYLNGASSPLTYERGQGFEPEYVDGEEILVPAALGVLDDLPIPVIGLPWFAVEHFPDAPIIAHEVGHDVEIDLGLEAPVRELIDQAVAKRHEARDGERYRGAWGAWARECFADVYATLALGPAFASTLEDFLVTDERALTTETRKPGEWTGYPTVALRLRLVAGALEATGFAAEADALRSRAGMDAHALADFAGDATAVAQALIAGPYPQIGRLDTLLAFDARSLRAAKEDAERLLDREQLQASDARILTAAARLAFDEDPRAYVKADASRRVTARITRMQDVGVRSAGGAPAAPVDRSDERDASLGAALSRRLLG